MPVGCFKIMNVIKRAIETPCEVIAARRLKPPSVRLSLQPCEKFIICTKTELNRLAALSIGML